MRLGIIGKPQSGKTTVFNAAAGQHVAVGDYSKATHRAIVKVPDPRLAELSEFIQPKKITPAEIEFVDSVGLSGKGKSSGEIEVSPELRLADAFLLVVDAFNAEAEPRKDIQDLVDEMILSDQVLIERNLEKKERKTKLTGDKSGRREIGLLKQCLEHLEQEKPLINVGLDADEQKILRGYSFLSMKPLLVVININEDDLSRAEEIEKTYNDFVDMGKREIAVSCGKVEMELVELEPDDRQQFLAELGIARPAVDLIVQKSYRLLGLISYLTAAEPEVRAWTIKIGDSAQKAAGVIHSDIERGFIRAEVTAYDDFVEYQTSAALKAAGKTRLEGKEYVVKDGDVILFRFNV